MKYSNLVSFEEVLKELSIDAKEQFRKEFLERTEKIAHEIIAKIAIDLSESFFAVVRKVDGRDMVEVQFTIKKQS